jgi:hypothetical protein
MKTGCRWADLPIQRLTDSPLFQIKLDQDADEHNEKPSGSVAGKGHLGIFSTSR